MTAARLVGAAIAFTIISFIVFSAGAFADMGYYTNPDYFPVWSKLFMKAEGPPGTEFYAFSLLFSFITGLIFAYVFAKSRGVFKEKGWKLGAKFGCCFFVVSTIPSSLSLILLINLPAALIISWAVQGLVASVLAGAAAAKIMK